MGTVAVVAAGMAEVLRSCPVTGRHVCATEGAEERHFARASLDAVWTASVEAADIGVGIDGATWLAGQADTPSRARDAGLRHAREQGAGVGMARRLEDFVDGSHLHDDTKVHH